MPIILYTNATSRMIVYTIRHFTEYKFLKEVNEMFIVVECHGGAEFAIVCTDINGDNLIFDTKEVAEDYANNECQNGVAVLVVR